MSRKFSLLALAIVSAPALVAGQNRAAAPNRALDLGGYLGELARWSAEAERLRDHRGKAAALRAELPPAWSVNSGEQHFEVSTEWLRSALEAVEKKTLTPEESGRRVQVRLKAMRLEAEALARGDVSGAATARSKLEEILSRREFGGVHGPSGMERFRNRAIAWLLNFLESLFRRLNRHPRATRVVPWLFVIVPGVIFLAWLAQLLLNRPKAAAPGEARQVAAPVAGWRELMRDALAATGRGDFRDSIRLAYWAGVYRLEELGVWKVEQTRTHREYLSLLPGDYPDRDSVSRLTFRFEQVWYGGQPVSSDDLQFAWSQLEKLGCRFPSIPATAGS